MPKTDAAPVPPARRCKGGEQHAAKRCAEHKMRPGTATLRIVPWRKAIPSRAYVASPQIWIWWRA